MASNIDRLLTARRRLWLIIAAGFCCCAMSIATTNRLQEMVGSDLNAEGRQQSLLAKAEQQVLKHLPRRVTGFRGGLGGGAATQEGGEAGPGVAKRATLETADPSGQQATLGVQGAEAGAGSAVLEPQNEASATQAASAVQTPGQCYMERHTDSWGDVLVWGEFNKKETPEECCQSCADYQPDPARDLMECNVWVFCEDPQLCGEHHKECWLKHRPHPDGANAAPAGPTVGWTTGLMSPPNQEPLTPPTPEDNRKYHVVVTAQGPAQHWQTRIAYYWYKKVKAQCEAQGNCQMGGFTRLLHSGEPDELMNEIPTFVANPLPPEHPNHGYVVLNRPYAFLQWINQARIPEKYVLMSEPDHIWLKPMPNLMRGQRPAAYPFFYIEPWKKEFQPIITKFLGPLTRVQSESLAPIGNAPTLMSMEDMKRVIPVFFNMSIEVHNDEAATKEWGWVQEMYAFTLACYKVGINKIDLFPKLMAQPPFDSEMGDYYILHYTYGNEFNNDGNMVLGGKKGEWSFDKRHLTGPIVRNYPEPPPAVGNEMVRHLIRAFNEATNRIPGWDSYQQTGRAAELWDGTL